MLLQKANKEEICYLVAKPWVTQAGAGAVQIDVEDVKLAVQMYAEHNLTSPPTRDILLEVASKKNSTQLPLPKATGGLRLPPDRLVNNFIDLMIEV